MKIIATEYHFDQATWTGGLSVTSPEPRSPILHVGNVLRDLENSSYSLKKGERPPSSQLSKAERARMGNYVEGGFIWEVLYEQVFRARMLSRRLVEAGVVSQQEVIFTSDGITMAMTPDGWCPGDDSIEEMKATWKTSRRCIPPEGMFDAQHFWTWGHQNKCYCKAWDTDRTKFFVFFVNGDYRESGPQVWQFDVTWSKQEIGESWRMVRNHGLKMLARKG